MYNILWEFFVKPGSEAEFEKHYEGDGTWAQFFRRGKGYVTSHLFRDVSNPLHFITLDQWNSQEQFQNFQNENGEEYYSIDKLCESLTIREVRLSEWISEE